MSADGCYADHVNAEAVANLASFRIEIVDNFHVVGNEADGDDHGVANRRLLVTVVDEIADIWLEPWLLRRTAAALVYECPIGSADSFGHQPAGFTDLFLIAGSSRHRRWNAVGGENKLGTFSAIGGEFY